MHGTFARVWERDQDVLPDVASESRSGVMAKEWIVTLNTGAKMPAFGLGTSAKPGEVGAAVEAALKAGYRHIDCAHVYMNEGEIGAALQKCFKEGVCKREDVFVLSKLGGEDTQSKDLVLPACQLTLKNLQLDYLDLYLVHGPFTIRKGAPFASRTDDDKLGYDPDRVAKTWEAMEELVAKGLVKAIGISNFTITKTERLLQTAKIVPAVNQVECHPYFQQPKLKEYLDTKGIVMQAYSPLGNPGRSSHTQQDPVVIEDPVINEIAKKHSVSAAQICIAFALHRGMVVIPKSTNPKRITENLKSTEIKLDADDMQRLREVDKNLRLLKLDFLLKPGQKWQEVWDIEDDEKFVIQSKK